MSWSEFERYRVPFSLKDIPLATKFVERPQIRQLQDLLLPVTSTHRRKLAVLHGMGGIGKTQLTVEFARRYQHHFSAVFWLDGKSEDQLKASFAAAARRLPEGQIPESSRTQATSGDPDAIVRDVLHWLSSEKNHSWLLIFDNVDYDYRESAPASAGAYDVRRFLPDADHGAIVITTRLATFEALGRALPIGRVDRGQAVELLGHGLQEDFEESEDCAKLLEYLDGLPLALVQAAAFMRETATPLAEYVQLYQDQWKGLMESEESNQIHEYCNGSIATTWMISYRDVKRINEDAADLLLLWACLDNKDLWFELIHQVHEVYDGYNYLPAWFHTAAGNVLGFKKIIRILLGYSLISRAAEMEKAQSSSYSMHPVVHEWMWQFQKPETRENNCRLAATVLGTVVPNENQRQSWVLQRRLLPHASRRVRNKVAELYKSCDEKPLITCEVVLNAFHRLGILYKDQGKLDDAEHMYHYALRGRERFLGPENLFTLATVNNLGMLFTIQGKLRAAEDMYRRVLEGREKLLGPDDALTLNALHNLGSLYYELGKLREAQEMLERVLNGYEKSLGPEHQSTLRVVNNIAIVYTELGKSTDAEQLSRRALVGREKILGSQHPLTLDTVNDLAHLFVDLGKLSEAGELHQRALEGREAALGPIHSSTLATVNGLGVLYWKQDKLEDAVKMFKRALRGREETLGPKHLSTLAVMNNLGILYRSQGKLEKAEQMLRDALDGYESALGPEHANSHPDVLNTLENLGQLLAERGQAEDAKELYQRALKATDEALGPDNPRSLRIAGLLSSLQADRETVSKLSDDLNAV